ncbi:LacI family DNA-binding transcriptional regulator [Spiractinospora alimapuensis]|uniref:LacI family DNA-binding transcriptional regulator n=1 Tax=Spiractinospora alimapuensis TaxID=2820884 RepID=UPI001F1FEC8E|nr:LacI family DNA-binding transcriptional regulator [Spiractinospora alimapuensis]QVQ53363.1 LacI family DNA-binding transcriptional regulator [Spiractinospora alimapuensis]
MATLTDVARLAGVSLATASRVMNDSSYGVAPELRQRVLAASEELQYVPNAHARALVSAKNPTVGVVVHDVSDPYFAEITRGLQQVAIRHNRLVLICNSYRAPEREADYLAQLRAQRVEALVLVGSGYVDPEATRTLVRGLNAFSEGGGRVTVVGRHPIVGDTIAPDNVSGGYAAGRHLFGQGHRELAVVTGPPGLTTVADRMTGMRSAAEEHEVEIGGDRVWHGDFTRDGGAEATDRLLRRWPRVTAIAAHNDAMAVGVMAVLRDRGLRVPEDVSVIGFNDMPIARDVTPPLTTIRLPLVEMGERAMTLALSRQEHPAVTETFPATLVVRDSTRPPR